MSGDDVSPLGRYAGPPPADEAALVTVHLLGTPLRLLAAGREWHDSVMAELRSRALHPDAVPPGTPPRLVELTETLGVRYAAAAPRPDAEVDAALDAGQRCKDLTYRVPVHATLAATMLDDLLTEVDGFCAQGLLLTEPRPPLLVAFTTWWTEQFRRQCDGQPPQPWGGPVELPG